MTRIVIHRLLLFQTSSTCTDVHEGYDNIFCAGLITDKINPEWIKVTDLHYDPTVLIWIIHIYADA
jgi:hypothetical protein